MRTAAGETGQTHHLFRELKHLFDEDGVRDDEPILALCFDALSDLNPRLSRSAFRDVLLIGP
jgi:hypothetical protein